MNCVYRKQAIKGALGLCALSSVPESASAQIALITSGIDGCDFATGKLLARCIPNFIGYLVQMIFGIVGLICLVTIMFAGYEIALGSIGGDTTGGKQRLLYAIIGLVVSTCAFLLVDFTVSALLQG